MLRRTKTNSKKRHSMFLDIRSTRGIIEEEKRFDPYQGKNKSAEALNSGESSLAGPTTTTTKKPQSRGRLKRSSVILDNTLVRDYNLAIKHFEKLDTRPIQPSHSTKSIASTGSAVSSLFSSTSTRSIRDLLYDDFESDEQCEIVDKTHNRLKFHLFLEQDEDSPQCVRTDLHFE